MEPLRITIAHNLTELRKSKNLTQGELAEKFNYSDKSVSKWEHGETTPDIETLKQLCDFYGVTLDYLTHEGTNKEKKQYIKPKGQQANKNVIMALSVSVVWILAATIYVGVQFLNNAYYWMAFLWAMPASFILLVIFSAIWGKHPWNTVCIIGLVWTLLLSLYLELGVDIPNGEGWKFWMLFLIGVPLTVAAILWSHIKPVEVKD
ncbi:MAG: HTH-type transcriptional regulator ImmR [Tenericutes bacterium ADurb.BinA155]|nr:MAG: HTH-type transcriptional regulator ImmR [Tenericutes bacterium ADurb.BinA155]